MSNSLNPEPHNQYNKDSFFWADEPIEDKNLAKYRKMFEELEPMEHDWQVPDIPFKDKVGEEFYNEVICKNLERAGAIPKKDLKKDTWYYGDTRNTGKAYWNGERFYYIRNKWNHYFWDWCPHYEDDYGYALFVPLREIDAPHIPSNLSMDAVKIK